MGYKPNSKGPLSDIRVLDLTRLAAGNMLTHLLADFGADVIKVERPGHGDDLRRFGSDEIWWKEYSRSKKSLTLDLKSKAGKKILLKLVAQSDVLVENFVPGGLEKWGLSPKKLLTVQPDLIIVRISGWGQTGPFAEKPGFGSLIEGYSGFAAMSGFADNPPLLPPLALADMIAGISGFGASILALLAKEKGLARGQVIDLSLFEPLFSILGPSVASFASSGKVPNRLGNRSEIAAPRNIYVCSDGCHLVLSASMQSMWEKLARAIDQEELIADPRFKFNQDRVMHMDDLDRIIGAFISKRTLEQNLQHFAATGVTVGPILDASDLIRDEYMLGRGVLETFPDKDLGTIPMHAVYPRFSKTPGAVRAPAPSLGQHTVEILDEIGISNADQEKLIKNGVI